MTDKKNIIHRQFCFMYRTESGFGKKTYWTNVYGAVWIGLCFGIGASIPLGVLFFLAQFIFSK